MELWLRDHYVYSCFDVFSTVLTHFRQAVFFSPLGYRELGTGSPDVLLLLRAVPWCEGPLLGLAETSEKPAADLGDPQEQGPGSQEGARCGVSWKQ